MAFTFEQAVNDLMKRLPEDRGTGWLAGRFSWLVGSEERLRKEFIAHDPDAASIHRLLFEQYAHLRDCPTYPGQSPYSDEARQAALDIAENFAQATQLPLETVQANWEAIVDNIYPGEQERIDKLPTSSLTE